MLHSDPLLTRPTLVHTGLLAQAVDGLKRSATSPVDMWRLLTENYIVDLDAVAALMPVSEPEPVWLSARD
ncbi:hypothetical protein AFCDBAGC_3054 [Methylobacterium cerastii]|uniref:Uncharacterized protein n=1 Tax=Methylobacterium cerastii TaxID=932741 RepID=A0ABQ4QIV1_9HYPH|nr:hypothetical protein [Methylobacterium cerastii]GJD45183.1 hypothetical protein AFCDBAGC_3054 [Methylobacterium cerastii]